MQQPKKKLFTMEEATKKRDSLDYESQLKKQAAYQSNDTERAMELMKRAAKDKEDSDKFRDGIKRTLGKK
jgi:hypothetical protein